MLHHGGAHQNVDPHRGFFDDAQRPDRRGNDTRITAEPSESRIEGYTSIYGNNESRVTIPESSHTPHARIAAVYSHPRPAMLNVTSAGPRSFRDRSLVDPHRRAACPLWMAPRRGRRRDPIPLRQRRQDMAGIPCGICSRRKPRSPLRPRGTV